MTSSSLTQVNTERFLSWTENILIFLSLLGYLWLCVQTSTMFMSAASSLSGQSIFYDLSLVGFFMLVFGCRANFEGSATAPFQKQFNRNLFDLILPYMVGCYQCYGRQRLHV